MLHENGFWFDRGCDFGAESGCYYCVHPTRKRPIAWIRYVIATTLILQFLRAAILTAKWIAPKIPAGMSDAGSPALGNRYGISRVLEYMGKDF